MFSAKQGKNADLHLRGLGLNRDSQCMETNEAPGCLELNEQKDIDKDGGRRTFC